jgi:hypothetical protein
MIVHDPGDHPYVVALAISVVLIVGVLVVSVAWPDMLPWMHGGRATALKLSATFSIPHSATLVLPVRTRWL